MPPGCRTPPPPLPGRRSSHKSSRGRKFDSHQPDTEGGLRRTPIWSSEETMRARHSRWFAAMVACVSMLAWMCMTNHCALASLSMRQMHSCCHSDGGAKDHPGSPQYLQCCGTVAPSLPDHLAVPAAKLFEIRAAWIEATALLRPAPESRGDLAFTTGPPPGQSFLEVILSRSMPAHAPPSFVA